MIFIKQKLHRNYEKQYSFLTNPSYFLDFFKNLQQKSSSIIKAIRKPSKEVALPLILPFEKEEEENRRKQAFLQWQEKKNKEKKEEMETNLAKKKEDDEKKEEETKQWRSLVMQKVEKQRNLQRILMEKGKKRKKFKKQKSLFYLSGGIKGNSGDGMARTALEFVRKKKEKEEIDRDIKVLVGRYLKYYQN